MMPLARMTFTRLHRLVIPPKVVGCTNLAFGNLSSFGGTLSSGNLEASGRVV